jgi:hypothetical protein
MLISQTGQKNSIHRWSVVSQGLAGVVVQDYKRWVSNPLLGGAEAEGFGAGVRHEEPTPALRATPPKRGFKGKEQRGCKIQVLPFGAKDARSCWAMASLSFQDRPSALAEPVRFLRVRAGSAVQGDGGSSF